MTTTQFPTTSFAARVGSMLRLDFYRLTHTPALGIALLIAGIIPAMVLTMTSAEGTAPPLTNTWQVVESEGRSDLAGNPLDMGAYASINMVFIFAGILLAIFVSRDYSSGFAKAIFTAHSKKIDYAISKTTVGLVGGTGMILTYTAGAVLAGLFSGKAFTVDLGGLVMCLVAKTLLMGVFCPLFLCVAVFFKNRFWLTAIFTFLVGMMLYPAASIATLNATPLTVLAALAAGAVGLLVFGAASTRVLNQRDLA